MRQYLYLSPGLILTTCNALVIVANATKPFQATINRHHVAITKLLNTHLFAHSVPSNDAQRHANAREKGKLQNGRIGQTLFRVLAPILLKYVLKVGKRQG